jgi:hypothetical protein
VDLTPHSGIGDIAEGRKINSWDKRPACSCQDHNLVRSILRNPVKSVNKRRVILSRKD